MAFLGLRIRRRARFRIAAAYLSGLALGLAAPSAFATPIMGSAGQPGPIGGVCSPDSNGGDATDIENGATSSGATATGGNGGNGLDSAMAGVAGGCGGHGGAATAIATSGGPSAAGDATALAAGGTAGSAGTPGSNAAGSDGGAGGSASAVAKASGVTDASANATATGGAGGAASTGDLGAGTPGLGGEADASAVATGTGNASLGASAQAGDGGSSPGDSSGASGGAASITQTTATAGNGTATITASATGGSGGDSTGGEGGQGGDATVNTTATTNGSTAASISASNNGSAIAGDGGNTAAEPATGGDGGSATAIVRASATNATNASVATATARAGSGGANMAGGSAGSAGSATSFANSSADDGQEARAIAIAQNGLTNIADATAVTASAGTNPMQVTAQASVPASNGDALSSAIADVGTGQAFGNAGQTAFAFATGLPSRSYLDALVPAGSIVYEALIAPSASQVIGAGIVGANHGAFAGSEIYSDTIDFDFPTAPSGSLYLGLIGALLTGGANFQAMDFDVEVNSVQELSFSTSCSTDPNCLADAAAFFDDHVFLLGDPSGPALDIEVDYDLTADGPASLTGDFIVGTVSEPASAPIFFVALASFLVWRWCATRLPSTQRNQRPQSAGALTEGSRPARGFDHRNWSISSGAAFLPSRWR